MRTSKVAVASAALAVALTAASCGAGTETVTSSGASLAKVVHAAAARSAAEPGSAWSQSSTINGHTIITGQFAGPLGSLNGQGTEFPSTGTVRTIPFRIVDNDFYFAFPHLPAGKKWIEATQADLKRLGIDETNLQRQEGSEAFAFLRAASDQVTVLGHGSIDGVSTTHYRLIVHARDLQRETKVLSPKLADQQAGMFGESNPVEVWIDGTGLVRKMTYSLDLSKSSEVPPNLPSTGILRYRYDFKEYGNVPVPTPPPASEVVPFSEIENHRIPPPID